MAFCHPIGKLIHRSFFWISQHWRHFLLCNENSLKIYHFLLHDFQKAPSFNHCFLHHHSIPNFCFHQKSNKLPLFPGHKPKAIFSLQRFSFFLQNAQWTLAFFSNGYSCLRLLSYASSPKNELHEASKKILVFLNWALVATLVLLDAIYFFFLPFHGLPFIL